MADPLLVEFVKASLSKGASRNAIESALSDAGWAGEQVRDALAQFAESEFVEPVPKPRLLLSARDSFLYLLLFVMLYLSAYNFGALLFAFVDLALPRAVGHLPEYHYSAIRWAISVLVIAFPVFLAASYRVARDIEEEPVRRSSPVRRWLTYLTLFAASVLIVGDLIYLVFSFLSGELSTRFVLKTLIVGGISAALFTYYLRSARNDEKALGQ